MQCTVCTAVSRARLVAQDETSTCYFSIAFPCIGRLIDVHGGKVDAARRRRVQVNGELSWRQTMADNSRRPCGSKQDAANVANILNLVADGLARKTGWRCAIDSSRRPRHKTEK